MTYKITIVAALLMTAFSVSPIMAQGAGQPNRASNATAQNAVDPGEVVRLLQSGNLDDAAKATITSYLRNTLLPWTDQKNAADLRKFRSEIQSLVNGVSNPQGKAFLLEQLLNNFYGFANRKDFYPACRYNAILALGDLDESIQDGRPNPYPRALAALYQAYNTKDENDTSREAIRLGALIGIRRHVVLGISNAQVRDGQIAKLLMDIVADTPYKDESDGASSNTDENVIVISSNPNALKTSEPHRTVELHNWFRNNAIETLGHLSGASVPTQNAIIATLLARMEDHLELPAIRYQSAYSLARFNRTIETSPDLVKKTTSALLTLGQVVHDDGIQTMLEEQSTQTTFGSMSGGMSGGGGMRGGMGMSSGGMSDMGGSGSTMGQTQADQINNSLIQIKDGLTSIAACVQGSSGLMNSEAVKNMPYHEVLVGLNRIIADCVKFLDEGDPEAARRARAAAQPMAGGMSGSTNMGPGGMTGMGGTMATTTVKNQPKVTMKEIEDRLKIVKNDIERLKSIMNALDSEMMAALSQ